MRIERLVSPGMEIVHQLVVLLHLIGFAALFGGFLVQVRTRTPEINAAMLHGALTQLITGIVLVVLSELGPDPVNHVKVAVKLLVTIFVVVVVVMNRKYAAVPRGLWGLIGGLTLANAAVAVLWQ